MHVADAAFWLATCRAEQGRRDEATALYERSAAVRSALGAGETAAAALAEAERVVAEVSAGADTNRAEVAKAEAARRAAQDTEAAAREALQAAQTAHAALEAERGAIAALLGGETAEAWPALIDAVSVAPGLEAALGAALGDDLQASTDPQAPVHWRTLDAPDDGLRLPTGAEPLNNHVEAPPALNTRSPCVSARSMADSMLEETTASGSESSERLTTISGDSVKSLPKIS